MNKNIFYIAGLAIIVLVVGWVIIYHPTQQQIQSQTEQRTAIASGHPEWPPIMFKNGDQIDGAGPALLKKIFQDLNLKVSVNYTGTWDEVQAKAKSGEVDVLVAAYKTSERETYMDYSEAYTTDPVVLFVKKGKTFPFTDWQELIGKKGVAMTGDSYGQSFDDFEKASLHLPRVTTSQEAFDMLTNGKADYFLYSLYAGEDFMKKQNMTESFESLPTYVDNENFYITISKKSPFLKYLPQINAEIEKYKADGTIDQLIKNYK